MARLSRYFSRLRFRAVVAVLLISALTLYAQGQETDPPKKKVRLERGRVLELSLVTALDSGHSQVGDEISLTLARALTVDGAIVLPSEWTIHGRITKVERAGKHCKDGKILWRFEQVTTPDGRKIKVQPIPDYIASPAGLNGTVVDRVSLETTGQKVRGKISTVAEYTLLAPVVVLLSPLLIPMAIAVSGGECAIAGTEEQFPAGTRVYAAVSKDVLLFSTTDAIQHGVD